MRTLRVVLSLFLFVASCFAADLKVKVIDPDSAVVPNARVELYRGSRVISAQSTSSSGTASFSALTPGGYRIQVLAQSFAAETVSVAVDTSSEITVQLHLAIAAEAVEVSAALTPLRLEESGADIASLNRPQLELLQPVSAADALRFLPGAVLNAVGRRGGQTSLFVRGGDSRYNKVLVDGIPVNDPGGTFDFGLLAMPEFDRLEFLRGAQSALYGSDAMTSVVQVWSRQGNTPTPELRLAADGGNFATAQGYASVSGARDRLDYNLFGDQFNTQGQGVNDDYSNSSQGANVGVRLSDRVFLRLRARHSNSRSGVPGEWNFNGQPLLPPDLDQSARVNNFLGGAELAVAAGAWQHRFSGYEYNHKGTNMDTLADRGCDVLSFNFTDCFFSTPFNVNRAGFSYVGDYAPRGWTHMVVGYEFEDENGSFDTQFVTVVCDPATFECVPGTGGGHTRGLRRNHALFGQEIVTWRRLTLRGGLRYVHNESFGDKAVPQVSASFVALRGGDVFSGTRLRFSYAEGIKEPRFEESFGISGTYGTVANPFLQPEENRSFEAGLQQKLLTGKAAFSATYFNNYFRDQIQYSCQSEPPFLCQYINLGRSLAHGAELQFDVHPLSRLMITSAYTYTSTQILLAPASVDPESPYAQGKPLLRRPRHSGTLLATWTGNKWGATLGGTFVGRRPDSDFLVPPLGITSAAGYGRLDVGGWYAITSRVTAYANVANVLNKHYEEVVGYPALRANFRAGLRLRIGGE
ncbi:MAG: TonB-dependent receptor [Terriglobales bacterium]